MVPQPQRKQVRLASEEEGKEKALEVYYGLMARRYRRNKTKVPQTSCTVSGKSLEHRPG